MGNRAQVAGIVLAAGFSRRLGRPKQAIVLGGETLVERAARTALGAGLSPVCVVLNEVLSQAAPAQVERLESLGCRVLVNDGAAEGMASSVRCGVEALARLAVSGAVLMTCDQIAVTSEHLRSLCADPAEAAGSGYAGKVGVPAFFPESRFAELLALRGDQGARELLRTARVVPTEALALDVDTEENLAQAESWLREHAQ